MPMHNSKSNLGIIELNFIQIFIYYLVIKDSTTEHLEESNAKRKELQLDGIVCSHW